MENKVYLYIFKDNEDCTTKEYHIITKHDCTRLIEDIEHYYYDIIDYEDKSELVAYLKDEKVSETLINFVEKDNNFDSCYELEIELLNELDEIINFTEKTFYY